MPTFPISHLHIHWLYCYCPQYSCTLTEIRLARTNKYQTNNIVESCLLCFCFLLLPNKSLTFGLVCMSYRMYSKDLNIENNHAVVTWYDLGYNMNHTLKFYNNYAVVTWYDLGYNMNHIRKF